MTQQAQTSVVAITGGMGSGKSSVAAYLCEIDGAKGLSADTVCRQLLEPGASGWLAVRNLDARFFLADQRLDRPKLRKVLFADHEFRIALNTLLHPLIRNEIASLIEKETVNFSQTPVRFVVEVPLLYEAHWDHDFSQIVVVYSDKKTCLSRIMLRDRISEDEAEKAMETQMPSLPKALLAQHVIDNSGAWSDTCLQVLHLRNLLW